MKRVRAISISRSLRTVVLFTLLATVGGCTKTKAPAGSAGPLPVNVVAAIEKDVTEWSEFTGRMESVNSVEIRPRVSGYITEVRFTAGDIVKEGDPLFLIDPRPYQAELDRATAALEQTQAQQKLAEIDFRRVENLKQKQVVAAEEYDQKAAALAQAQATARAAQASRDTAALNIDFTQIKSPIAGRTSNVRITIGNLVQSDSVLTTVVSVDPFYVYADADENTVLRIMKMHAAGDIKSVREQKTAAFAQLGNEKDFPHEGYVDFVDNRVDPNTGTLRLRGVFKSWDPLLAPGFFARMRIPVGAKAPAVLIPDEVITSQQNLTFVYVVKPDKTIERRNIEIGEIDEGLRIVHAGLKAGEQIVSTRLQILRPGMSVQPVPQQNAGASPSPAATAK